MKNLKQGSYIKIILDEADEYAKKRFHTFKNR